MGVCFSCFCCRRKTEPDTPGCIQNNMPPVPGVVSVPVPTVPIRNSMPLKTEQWYFRKMSRIEAEKYLLSHVNSHRSMIIRDSETSKNAYSLSVRYGNIVYHYRIKKIHSSFFIVENIKFKNLRGLVEHYSKVLSKLQASGVKSDEPLIETMQSKNVNHCYVPVVESDKPLIETMQSKNVFNHCNIREMGSCFSCHQRGSVPIQNAPPHDDNPQVSSRPLPPMPDLVLTNTTYASAKRFGALNYYGERTDEDFKFRKGEHLQTKVEQWFFGNINRLEAEKLLLLPINDNGSFLIRNSESEIHGYSLSVRCGDRVRHYRIKRFYDSGYFIVRRTTFNTLHEIVNYYSKIASLKPACVQAKKQITDRFLLEFDRKLTHGQFGKVCGLWNSTTTCCYKTSKTSGFFNDPKASLAEVQIIKKLSCTNTIIQLLQF